MSTTHPSPLCSEVDDRLTEVLDGTAPVALYDHIADCDACRDRRHVAEEAAGLVGGAGADFVVPAGFADRLAEAVLASRAEGRTESRSEGRAAPARASSEPHSLEAQPSEVQPSEPQRSEPRRDEPAPLEATAPTELALPSRTPHGDHEERDARDAGDATGARDAAHDTAPSREAPRATEPGRVSAASAHPAGTSPGRLTEVLGDEPEAATRASHAPAGPTLRDDEAPPEKKVARLDERRRSMRRGVIGAVAVLAAVAAGSAGWYIKGKAVEGPAAASSAAPVVDGPWAGTVTSVARAASDKTGGLEACEASGACTSLAAGAEIKAGTKLRTDARTRAFVKLADGTQLALDRGTELELLGGEKRAARVVAGTVVAEISELPQPEGSGAKAEPLPARFELGSATATVLAAKLSMTATKDHASIEVARGSAKLRADGRESEVRAGEEATLAAGRSLEIAASTTIADVMEWSDRTEEEVDGPSLRGVGELRAKKPGQTQEKDKAVRLTKHAVKTRIVDVIARTEIDETFTNDTDEELEGIYRFPLPPGAQIERLALEVDGKLMEGAFVDRDKGAAIWRGVIQNAAPKAPRPREEIIWVPGPWRDPALLEWQRGGRFELRIFPIPKRGSRRVVLTYTQTLEQTAGVRRYTYPLAHDAAGSTTIEDFSFDLQVIGHDKAFGMRTRGYDLVAAQSDGSAERKTMAARAFRPAGDLTLEFALPHREKQVTAWAYQPTASEVADQKAKSDAGAKALKPEEKEAQELASAVVGDGQPYVALAVRPNLPRWSESREHVHAIVVDSSRSMVGERFARAKKLATAVVREMDRRDKFVMLACDTTCRAMGPDGRATAPGVASATSPGAAAAEQVDRFLGTIEPDGGSDLAGAMLGAKASLGTVSGKDVRVIYLGDGTPSVGPTRPKTIEAAVRSVFADSASQSAVVAVALGSDADTHALEATARGGGGVMVPYVPGQKVSSAALDVLTAAYGRVLRDVTIELPPGLTMVRPTRLDPIRAGGEAFVVARMSGTQVNGTVRVRGRVANESFEQSYPVELVASQNAGNAFVPRMFAAATIADLERDGTARTKPAIVELSKRFAVASRHTSLIVLESEAMFRAFGLDQAKTPSLFTGEEGAVSTRGENERAIADEQAEGADKKKDAAGFGLGLDGVGHGGGGQGRLTADMPMPSPTSSMGPMGAPAAAEPAPMAPPPAKVAGASKPRPMDSFDDELGASRSPARWRPPPNRRMVPMRRVFDRKAAFEATNLLARDNATKLVSIESALSINPDSRDKTKELLALYSMAGRLGEAQELAAKWAGRDALDADALVARAELFARQGDRDRAFRVLGGLADVRPGDKAIQVRLADAHEAMGNAALACRHRITAAELAPTDAKAVATAITCSSAQRLGEVATLLRLDVPETQRAALDRELGKPSTAGNLVGDVQVTATWSGGEDLDLALIDKDGRRVSWLGAPSKLNVTAKDVASLSTESLGLSALPAGSYVVELTRAASAAPVVGGVVTANNVPAAPTSTRPISGELTFKLVNEVRKVPFVLVGNRVEVGSVRVFFTSRLVPVDGFGGGGWNGPVRPF